MNDSAGKSHVKIGEKMVGPGCPCFTIAEVALGHDGSLGFAYAFVDAAARAGADAIKFQTHIPEAESTPYEEFRVRFSPQDDTRTDYWKRTSFTSDEWRKLKEHTDSRGLVFLSSPFSLEAVELLDSLGMAAWKVASGEIANPFLLRAMADTGKPVLLSTGMAGWEEIDTAIALVGELGAPYGVFQTTTEYPCPPEHWGLSTIATLRERYGCPVGLSDHSGTIYAGLAAATLGANILEVHITLSKDMFGPDVPASITISQLSDLVSGIRQIETALNNPVDKDDMALKLSRNRDLFFRGLVAKKDLAPGAILRPEDLEARKPLRGIPAQQLDLVVGQRMAKPVARGEFLTYEHLEQPQ